MPIKKYKSGYKVKNTKTKKPMTKAKAKKQLSAIKMKKKELVLNKPIYAGCLFSIVEAAYVSLPLRCPTFLPVGWMISFSNFTTPPRVRVGGS